MHAVEFQGSPSRQLAHRSRPLAPRSRHKRHRGTSMARLAARSHLSTLKASMRLTVLLPVSRLARLYLREAAMSAPAALLSPSPSPALRHDWQRAELLALFDLPFTELLHRAASVH